MNEYYCDGCQAFTATPAVLASAIGCWCALCAARLFTIQAQRCLALAIASHSGQPGEPVSEADAEAAIAAAQDIVTGGDPQGTDE